MGGKGQAKARIHQVTVPPYFPSEGPVRALLVGEAPGPRGADKSGLPFVGDQAGKLLYRALWRAGLFQEVEVAPPGGLFGVERARVLDLDQDPHLNPWNGSEIAAKGVRPIVQAAITNAYDACPTDDGESFRKPSKKELLHPSNRARLEAELVRAREQAPGVLPVICLGTVASWMLCDILKVHERPEFRVSRLPHPAPQGILAFGRSEYPGVGVPELRELWTKRALDAMVIRS